MKTIKYSILIELVRNVNDVLYEWAKRENVASVEISRITKNYIDKNVVFGVNYGCCGTISVDKINVVIKMLSYAKAWADAMNAEEFVIEFEKEE